MKIYKLLLAATLLAACSPTSEAQVLPKPQVAGGMPLMEVMKARKSQRDIAPDKAVSRQDLSNMLWAAWGITHDGKRTIATATNRQELDFYVVTATEIGKYDAASNTLTTVATGDYRTLAAKQGFAATAPVNIVIVGDGNKTDKPEFMNYAAGAASQNIYLYCAQAGLKTVLRYGCDREGLAKVMKLNDKQVILYVQTVGQ